MRDETHDPAAASWVESANDPASEFPIQNLAFGMFRRHGVDKEPRIGVAIGTAILPLSACDEGYATLNDVMAQGKETRVRLRSALHRLLHADVPAATRERLAAQLVPMADADMALPARVGDYTDFFGSIHHAMRAAEMMRPDEPFFPNYMHMPLAYHGRASSVIVSGTPVPRPRGPRRNRAAGSVFEPTRRLDYEAELGYFVGPGNALGTAIPIERAWDHIVGVALMNDWSARDIQAWESDPLGPFLGKSFATTVSPWVVTTEALEPFRVAPPPRCAEETPPAYLDSESERSSGALRVEVELLLLTAAMRAAGTEPVSISRSNSATQYWTPSQLVAHHTANGCNLRPGDLLGSGTLSGPARASWACLLELTRGGKEPLALPNGESRSFLEDGDEVILRGRATAPGARSIGFGECRGRVYPATNFPT